ncbi:hypothetical protein [Nesterenkonia pannonica]|nr:hypothetical protein [Nesterenkonia pannonica]
MDHQPIDLDGLTPGLARSSMSPRSCSTSRASIRSVWTPSPLKRG